MSSLPLARATHRVETKRIWATLYTGMLTAVVACMGGERRTDRGLHGRFRQIGVSTVPEILYRYFRSARVYRSPRAPPRCKTAGQAQNSWRKVDNAGGGLRRLGRQRKRALHDRKSLWVGETTTCKSQPNPRATLANPNMRAPLTRRCGVRVL